jgi:hypothetical protein
MSCVLLFHLGKGETSLYDDKDEDDEGRRQEDKRRQESSALFSHCYLILSTIPCLLSKLLVPDLHSKVESRHHMS